MWGDKAPPKNVVNIVEKQKQVFLVRFIRRNSGHTGWRIRKSHKSVKSILRSLTISIAIRKVNKKETRYTNVNVHFDSQMICRHKNSKWHSPTLPLELDRFVFVDTDGGPWLAPRMWMREWVTWVRGNGRMLSTLGHNSVRVGKFNKSTAFFFDRNSDSSQTLEHWCFVAKSRPCFTLTPPASPNKKHQPHTFLQCERALSRVRKQQNMAAVREYFDYSPLHNPNIGWREPVKKSKNFRLAPVAFVFMNRWSHLRYEKP